MTWRWFQAWPPLAWGSLATAGLLLLGSWLVPVPLKEIGPPTRDTGQVEIIPLLDQRQAAGRITAHRSGLVGVRLRVATYMRRNTCLFQAELIQDGRVLAAASRRADWFPDFGWVRMNFFTFGPHLPPGEYQVRFQCLKAGPQNCVALFGRAGGGAILEPIYLVRTEPIGRWLRQNKPDHARLLSGLIVFLAAGGLVVGLGASLRRS